MDGQLTATLSLKRKGRRNKTKRKTKSDLIFFERTSLKIITFRSQQPRMRRSSLASRYDPASEASQPFVFLSLSLPALATTMQRFIDANPSPPHTQKLLTPRTISASYVGTDLGLQGERFSFCEVLAALPIAVCNAGTGN